MGIQECPGRSYRKGEDRMKGIRRIKQVGFTLIEVLIALFVLSMVLLPMSTMVYSVMSATALSKEVSTATTLAQDLMERFKNLSFSSLNSGNDSTILGNVTYDRQWTVSTAGNMKTIAVTVNWTDRIPHNVSMTTQRGE